MYSSEQYSVHRFSICRSCVRHFPERSWTVVAFPCFSVIKPFTSWYGLLLLFFLRFSSISLQSSPIQFSFAFFHVSLDVVVHFLVFLRSFRLESFLSQFPPFVAHIKNVCSDRCFCLSSDDVCQGSHWLFQSLLCWRWWSLNLCLYLRYSWWWEVQFAAYHSLEGFQHVGIFQLFEVKLESCVFWLVDSFQAK